VEDFTTERHGDPRKHGEKFIEQRYHPCRPQSLGKTGVSPHIGEQHRGMGCLGTNYRCIEFIF
jgi:hypothetical protein